MVLLWSYGSRTDRWLARFAFSDRGAVDSASVFKSNVLVFGYFVPEYIFQDNENKQLVFQIKKRPLAVARSNMGSRRQEHNQSTAKC